jgi:Tfp pilus assembly protein PilN
MAKKTAKRRAWTAGDVRELKGFARQKMPVARMARALRRSESATRQKLNGLGLSLRSRRAKSSRSGSARRRAR